MDNENATVAGDNNDDYPTEEEIDQALGVLLRARLQERRGYRRGITDRETR